MTYLRDEYMHCGEMLICLADEKRPKRVDGEIWHGEKRT